jgi:RimJ/RimL family protein N-acetyltransferase
MDACRAYLKAMRESQHAFWAVETRDGRHIGNMTAVIDRNNDVADLSIMIGDRSVWGQGYGTSAWLGACNYLMGEGNMRKVRAGTMHVNQPMLTLMKKAGMKEDGVWRRHLMFEGREVDVVFAALFRHRG